MFEVKIKKIPVNFLGYVIRKDEKVESLIERFPNIVIKRNIKNNDEIINLAKTKENIEIIKIEETVKEIKIDKKEEKTGKEINVLFK